MGVRDQLEELLGAEDLAAECPTPQSALRRPVPVRLPLLEAIELCKTGEVKTGEVVAATEDGEGRAVARLESGAITVLADLCPHDGGLLSDGFVEGEKVVCARHGWEFDGHTGRCLRRGGVAVPCRVLKSPHI